MTAGGSGRARFPEQFSSLLGRGAYSASTQSNVSGASRKAKRSRCALHGALERLQLPGARRLDPAQSSASARRGGHREDAVAGPIGAARVAGEGHLPSLGVELHRDIVRPMLAQLLKIAAAAVLVGTESGADDRSLKAARPSARPRRGSLRSCAASLRRHPRGWRGATERRADWRSTRLIGAPPALRWSLPRSFEPLEQRLDLFLLLGEMVLAVGGDLEGLARPLGLHLVDQAHILEHGQRRIDDARARRIFAMRSSPRSRGSDRSRGAAGRRSA